MIGHLLIGRSAADFELPDGTRLAALLHDGKGLLLDFDAGAPLKALGADLGGRINYIHTEVKDCLGLGAVTSGCPIAEHSRGYMRPGVGGLA